MKHGDVFYYMFWPGDPIKCHVVGIVDDIMIVFKYYHKHKQRWIYKVEPDWIIDQFRKD